MKQPGAPAQRPDGTHRTLIEQLRLLLAPPRDVDVLVADEQVIYRAPKHLASLAEPAIETFAVLTLVWAILARPNVNQLGIGVVLIIVSGFVAWRWIQSKEWNVASAGFAVLLVYVFASQSIEPLVIAPAIGLGFLIRFALRVLRWWKYEVRYLTNRRIIEATGFLGLRVASMPVSRVTDLVLTRTALGETLGYGNLRIESAGQNQSLSNIPFLVEPKTFHRLAVRLATKPTEIDLKNFIDVRPVRQLERKRKRR